MMRGNEKPRVHLWAGIHSVLISFLRPLPFTIRLYQQKLLRR
jgi:hypothetical protein